MQVILIQYQHSIRFVFILRQVKIQHKTYEYLPLVRPNYPRTTLRCAVWRLRSFDTQTTGGGSIFQIGHASDLTALASFTAWGEGTVSVAIIKRNKHAYYFCSRVIPWCFFLRSGLSCLQCFCDTLQCMPCAFSNNKTCFVSLCFTLTVCTVVDDLSGIDCF